jgi:hypothetical protein
MMKTLRRLACFAICALGLPARADQVVMQNGDSLNGTILSVTTNVLVLKNDNLGNVTLPRAKVAAIVFGTGATKTTGSLPVLPPAGVPVPGPVASPTNSAVGLAALFRGLSDQTNLIQQVESGYLASAGPEAAGKFHELLDGLSTGKIDMNGLRAQAQSAANQLRSLKKDLGSDAGVELDAYLAILDNFLQETAPTDGATNSVNTTTNTGPAKP